MNTLVSRTALPHPPGSSLPDRLRDVVVRTRRTLHAWAERQRGRRALASLDEANLRDIGITRADAVFEASKPFWQP